MKLIASLTCALTLLACGDDSVDNPGDGNTQGTREFRLVIENIAPWTLLKTGSQATIAGTMMQGNIEPGQAYEMRFTAGPGHNLMFAMTLIESNDWFFAPDPAGIPLYVNGEQVLGDITNRVLLWDAGTEEDQELGVGDATCGNQPVRDYGAPDPDSRVRRVTQTQHHGFPIPAVSSMVRVTLEPGSTPDGFVLRVENVSTETTLQTSQGPRSVRISPVAYAISRHTDTFFTEGHGVRPNGLGTFAETGNADALASTLRYERGVATPLGRGVFLVHREPGPLFYIDNPDYGMGLESLVEDGDERPLLTNLQSGRDSSTVGAFDTPVGASSPGPAAPGQSFEVTFRASPGDKLAIATSFLAANDWFFGSPLDGIPLFLGDIPRWEDITPDIRLYDLGTESDEELDVGLNTGTQQTMPNSGRPDRVTTVREVTQDRYGTPINQHVRLVLTPVEP